MKTCKEMHLWRLVKRYECPDCGELVLDMCDACNHVCKKKDSKQLERAAT